MASTYFISAPLKKSSDVDLLHPLRNFISSSYSSVEHPEDYTKQLTELQKLRDNAINRVYEKHENSLDHLYRYYDQLCALEAKFPLTENQVRISFKWKDAFDKGTLFTGRLSLTLCSGAFEKACILFNIAALDSQIGEMQNIDSDDGLKQAAKYFQQSAGIFSYLRDNVLSMIQQDPTPDLCPDTLNTLAQLMLAQGQESICMKAMKDNMKDAIIAKVAMQCCDYYAEALKLLQLPQLRSYWDKDWIPKVAGKQALYHGLAEYYQSRVASTKKVIGEEIARLQKADELLRTAQARSSDTLDFSAHVGKIQRDLTSAKKDNDFIYHERIPEYRSLPSLGKAALAKAVEVPKQFSSNFNDLFEALVPIQVQQALGVFEARKTELVNGEIGKLREYTQLMNSCLASMNLPAAVEDFSGKQLPSSLKEKSKAVREGGGITSIERMMRELPDALQRNREILDEADKMLNEEQESDRKLKEEFKDKWTRTASNKLTEPLRQESGKYRQILHNATSADATVREKFSKHKDNIVLLSRSEGELQAALPSTNPATNLQDSPAVVRLRGYMEDVATIKAERDVIESELKSTTNNMQSQFLSALAKSNALNEEALSVEELGRVYGPLQKQVRDSVARQEQLMGEVQESNTEFCSAKSASGGGAAQREQMLKDLAAAHDMFMEIKGNLEEGNKFYNDLTPLLVKFQSKCSDLCFARKTEKDELLKDIQTSIVNQPSATPPSRPPPPVVSATAATSPTAATSQPAAQPAAQPATAPPTAPAPAYSQPPYNPTPAAAAAAAPPYPGQSPYMGMPPMPAMPPGYNPYMSGGYNPYAPAAGYNPYAPQAGYPTQQGYPSPYPGGYPQQQQQQQHGQMPPYPTQQQWR